MCKQFIYKHIRSLPADAIITTRELLIYGTRSAVDTTLSRMVADNFLVRLARGVFVKDSGSIPGVAEIAAAKARAFGLRITKHAEHILRELNLASGVNTELQYAKNGGSSSFATVHGRVHMKGISERKMALAETKVGQIIYALWFLGVRWCREQHVKIAVGLFQRNEREELRRAAAVIPSWLNALCIPFHTFRRPDVRPAERPSHIELLSKHWSDYYPNLATAGTDYFSEVDFDFKI